MGTVFLKGSRHHRELHSFPTRRSSDLKMSVVPSSLKSPVPLITHAGGTAARDTSCATDVPFISQIRTSPVEASRNRMSDRKSTRLNSSHPSISYAVFCLKKTNKLQTAS